jgi:hypothetical protein
MCRFWRMVDMSGDGCWPWRGATWSRNYGCFRYKGRPTSAHRVAWLLERGPIPKGMFVLHACDNPPCVNPEHLFLGTSSDNAFDREKKGRGGVHGEDHGNAVLTTKQVKKMRQLKTRGMSLSEIAKRFDFVTKSCIWGVLNGNNWRHVL